MMSRVARAIGIGAMYPATMPVPPSWEDDPIGLYRTLRAYYDNTALYDTLNTVAVQRQVPLPSRRPLRNPAHRVVEFYVTHLWPSEFVIETENEAIREPIEQVWVWSNWQARQRLFARLYAMYGDGFLKVVSRRATDTEPGRVYLQVLDPETVIDYDEDDRGFLTYLHIEVDRMERTGDKVEQAYITEIWDLPSGYRLWRKDRRMRVEELGAPAEVKPLTDFGIEFIPVVHAKFQDVGWKRGAGSFTHAIEKIDEANTQATRLHQLLFRHNDVTWALGAGGTDAAGRPLPPPQVLPGRNNAEAGDGTVELGGERFLRLPGMAKLESLVPEINYAAGLAILNAQLDEIERDLPELAFHRIREQGEISGRAARMMMTDAIDKIIEARGNASQALARANMMALTAGAALGLPGFEGVGTFEAGSFDHTFEAEDPIGISELEQAEADEAEARAAIAQQESGISVRETLRTRGYSEEEITQIEQEREDEAAAGAERAAAAFDRGGGGFPGGGPPEGEGGEGGQEA